MNYKKYGLHAVCIAAISCIALLITKSYICKLDSMREKTSTIAVKPSGKENDVKDKSSRIIIKPREDSLTADKNTTSSNNGTRTTATSVENNEKIQPLPPADADSPIIVNLLK